MTRWEREVCERKQRLGRLLADLKVMPQTTGDIRGREYTYVGIRIAAETDNHRKLNGIEDTAWMRS